MSLRLLVIAPRYHPDIIGGSERYLHQLVTELECSGVEVTVLTTCSRTTGSDGPHSLTWTNELDRRDVNGPGQIERFRTLMLPHIVRAAATARLGRTQLTVERATPVKDLASHFGSGFHAIETWGSTHPFRWTGRRAAIELSGTGLREARIELWSPRAGGVRAVVGGRTTEAALAAERWSEIAVDLGGTDRERIDLHARPYRPPADRRLLGVAVRRVGIRDATGDRSLDLATDRSSLLARLPTEVHAAVLDREARAFGCMDAVIDALLKGPLSPGLFARALLAARRADVVLATNAPFVSLGLGLAVARLAGRPVALLPFFHLRDRSHHRPAIRAPLARADRVFCLNQTMARFVTHTLAGRPALLGGGIDPSELSAASISGARFRAAHGLTGVPLILTVCRKTPDKGYPMVVDAIRLLRARGLLVGFVLVGPDQDGVRLDPDLVTYLGPLPRAELLDALDACDVFVLPSRAESFGLVYLEAWMRGRAVVGLRDCAAAAELIDAGTDGELVADADELAATLERLLADPTRRAALGAAGRAKTLAHHTWTAVGGRFRATLEEMIAAHRGNIA